MNSDVRTRQLSSDSYPNGSPKLDGQQLSERTVARNFERISLNSAIGTAWRNMTRADRVSPSQLFYGQRQRQVLPLTGEQAKSQESSIAGRDKTAGNSERYRNQHTANYRELHPKDTAWMQHHITGKWDTSVQVVRKRKDGNSYVVAAPDGNTYIRGRRLLKPISSPNTEEDTRSHTKSRKTSVDRVEKQAMPRRSPRNHVSTRAADIEIAARLTAIYLCDL